MSDNKECERENRNGEYIDMFFRSDAVGTHTYGEGDNADLYTCDQCMLIVRNGKNFYRAASQDILEPRRRKRVMPDITEVLSPPIYRVTKRLPAVAA